MAKTQDIRILFLSIVYLILLSSVVLPHHHHEETTCFTISHCEEDFEVRKLNSEDLEDHHHDHTTGKESEHCISLEYYMISAAGKNINQFSVSILLEHGHDFLIPGTACFKAKAEVEASDQLIRFLPISNTYTAFVRKKIPPRAPPAFVA